MIELELLQLIERQNDVIKDLLIRVDALERSKPLPVLQAIVDKLEMLSEHNYLHSTPTMNEVKRQLELLYEHTDEE